MIREGGGVGQVTLRSTIDLRLVNSGMSGIVNWGWGGGGMTGMPGKSDRDGVWR